MAEKYIFVGWACGRFDAEQRDGSKEKEPYYNIYVISAVSSWESEDYKAEGLKAEKMKCVSNAVWKDVEPGKEVDLYFDDIVIYVKGCTRIAQVLLNQLCQIHFQMV